MTPLTRTYHSLCVIFLSSSRGINLVTKLLRDIWQHLTHRQKIETTSDYTFLFFNLPLLFCTTMFYYTCLTTDGLSIHRERYYPRFCSILPQYDKIFVIWIVLKLISVSCIVLGCSLYHLLFSLIQFPASYYLHMAETLDDYTDSQLMNFLKCTRKPQSLTKPMMGFIYLFLFINSLKFIPCFYLYHLYIQSFIGIFISCFTVMPYGVKELV